MAAGMVWAGTTFNIIPLFEGRGLTEGQAAATLAVCAVAMAAVQPIAGVLADRLPLSGLLAAGSSAVTVSMAILIAMDSLWTAHLFGVFLGVGNGIYAVAANTLWPRYFGRRSLGKIRSGGMMALVLGSSLGPFLLGASQDYLDAFQPALFVFLGVNVVLAVAALFATVPGSRSSGFQPER